jgi:ABC-type glycerol-3-phosphate transport system substrate-binding protein
MKKSSLAIVALCFAMLAPALASAAPLPITCWDFLGGGDGVKWTLLVNYFNASQNEYKVTSTTLPGASSSTPGCTPGWSPGRHPT